MTQRYEIIEVDPATGEEDHLVTSGTLRAMERELRDLIAEMTEEWDAGQTGWSCYRLQPAEE